VDGVRVVGAFEGVVAARGEGFFAAGPADVVFGGGVFEFCCSLVNSRDELGPETRRTHLVLLQVGWRGRSSCSALHCEVGQSSQEGLSRG
jgi:hypothetical protein